MRVGVRVRVRVTEDGVEQQRLLMQWLLMRRAQLAQGAGLAHDERRDLALPHDAAVLGAQQLARARQRGR